MGHLQLVRVSGKPVETALPVVRLPGGRRTMLPALSLSRYVATLRLDDAAARDLREEAMTDARRFVRDLSARLPVAEVRGLCTWAATGDLLGEILPVVRSISDLEGAAHALRLVARLVMDGEELGAGMRLGDCILSIHGDGTEGVVTIHLQDGPDEMTLGLRMSREGRFDRVA